MRRFCLVPLMILLASGVGAAGYSQCLSEDEAYPVEEKKDPRVNRIEEAIKINNLLNLLDLDIHQMGFIIAKAKEIEGITRKLDREYRIYSSTLLRSENIMLDQVRSGRTVLDKSVERDYLEQKRLSNQVYYRINRVAVEGVKAVEVELKDFQLTILDGYTVCLIPALNEGRIGESDKSSGLIAIIEKSRHMSKQEYQTQKDILAERAIASFKGVLGSCRLREESIVRKEMLATMDAIRELDEAEFLLNKQKMSRELRGKILIEEPGPSRAQKILRFLLSVQSIPILEERLKAKQRR